MKSGIKPKMLLPFDYNLLILVIEHAYMVCPGTFIVLFWKLKGTSVYWPWSKGIHSSKAKSPNWRWLPTSKTNFLGFVGSLGTKTIDFWFARAIPWPTTRPIIHKPPHDTNQSCPCTNIPKIHYLIACTSKGNAQALLLLSIIDTC